MASTIEIVVLSKDGEELSHVSFNIEYGYGHQMVEVVLDENADMFEGAEIVAAATDSIAAFREVNEALVEHSILNCQSGQDDA